jgi:hypothetical protein
MAQHKPINANDRAVKHFETVMMSPVPEVGFRCCLTATNNQSIVQERQFAMWAMIPIAVAWRMLALGIERHGNMDQHRTVLRFLAWRLASYLAAVTVGYLLATITATQSVIHELGGMGVPVGLRDRAAMTLQDIRGLAGMFLPMVAFAYLAAFLSAALLMRWLARWRTAIYVAAGATALVMIHVTLKLAFGLTPVAVARTAGGLALQAVAGGVGGFTYLYLARRWPP